MRQQFFSLCATKGSTHSQSLQYKRSPPLCSFEALLHQEEMWGLRCYSFDSLTMLAASRKMPESFPHCSVADLFLFASRLGSRGLFPEWSHFSCSPAAFRFGSRQEGKYIRFHHGWQKSKREAGSNHSSPSGPLIKSEGNHSAFKEEREVLKEDEKLPRELSRQQKQHMHS